MKHVVTIFMLLLLNACATTPNVNHGESIYWKTILPKLQQIDTWRIDGRVKIKQAESAHVLSIIWSKTPKQQKVSLLAPLGQVVFNLTINSNQASIELSDGRVFYGQNSTQLVQNLVGYAVPISLMQPWLLGKTLQQANNNFNEHGRLVASQLNGWQLNIEDYALVNSKKHGETLMPITLHLTKDKTALRLIIDSWNIDSTNAGFELEDDFSSVPIFGS